jgi:hypothetical protein
MMQQQQLTYAHSPMGMPSHNQRLPPRVNDPATHNPTTTISTPNAAPFSSRNLYRHLHTATSADSTPNANAARVASDWRRGGTGGGRGGLRRRDEEGGGGDGDWHGLFEHWKVFGPDGQ